MRTKFSHKYDKESHIITIEGKFDQSIGDEIIKAIVNLPEADSITIDLSKCNYIDSLGLGRILVLRDKLKTPESKVKVVGANQDLKDTFLIVNFDKIIDLE